VDEQMNQATNQPTGHPAVDAVLESLADLDERPVQDHVATFEAAHEQLRAALAGAPANAPGTPAPPTPRH